MTGRGRGRGARAKKLEKPRPLRMMSEPATNTFANEDCVNTLLDSVKKSVQCNFEDNNFMDESLFGRGDDVTTQEANNNINDQFLSVETPSPEDNFYKRHNITRPYMDFEGKNKKSSNKPKQSMIFSVSPKDGDILKNRKSVGFISMISDTDIKHIETPSVSPDRDVMIFEICGSSLHQKNAVQEIIKYVSDTDRFNSGPRPSQTPRNYKNLRNRNKKEMLNRRFPDFSVNFGGGCCVRYVPEGNQEPKINQFQPTSPTCHQNHQSQIFRHKYTINDELVLIKCTSESLLEEIRMVLEKHFVIGNNLEPKDSGDWDQELDNSRPVFCFGAKQFAMTSTAINHAQPFNSLKISEKFAKKVPKKVDRIRISSKDLEKQNLENETWQSNNIRPSSIHLPNQNLGSVPDAQPSSQDISETSPSSIRESPQLHVEDKIPQDYLRAENLVEFQRKLNDLAKHTPLPDSSDTDSVISSIHSPKQVPSDTQQHNKSARAPERPSAFTERRRTRSVAAGFKYLEDNQTGFSAIRSPYGPFSPVTHTSWHEAFRRRSRFHSETFNSTFEDSEIYKNDLPLPCVNKDYVPGIVYSRDDLIHMSSSTLSKVEPEECFSLRPIFPEMFSNNNKVCYPLIPIRSGFGCPRKDSPTSNSTTD